MTEREQGQARQGVAERKLRVALRCVALRQASTLDDASPHRVLNFLWEARRDLTRKKGGVARQPRRQARPPPVLTAAHDTGMQGADGEQHHVSVLHLTRLDSSQMRDGHAYKPPLRQLAGATQARTAHTAIDCVVVDTTLGSISIDCYQ